MQILLTDGINIIYGENESGKQRRIPSERNAFGMERKRGRLPQQIHSVPMSLGRIQTFTRESCGLPAVTGDFAWNGISIGMQKVAL